MRYSGGFEVGRRQVRVSGSVCSPGAGVFQQLARAVSLGRLHLALRLGGRCKMACFGAKVAVSAAILVEGLHSGVDTPLCNVIKKVIPIQTLAFYNKIRYVVFFFWNSWYLNSKIFHMLSKFSCAAV